MHCETNDFFLLTESKKLNIKNHISHQKLLRTRSRIVICEQSIAFRSMFMYYK